MNLAELKNEIRGLGFSDQDTMKEYLQDGVLLPAVNRAIDFISATVRPIVGSAEILLSGDGYETYDMLVLAPGFLDFYGRPAIRSLDDYRYLNDFFIEENSKIVLRGEPGEVVTVFYKKRATPVTSGTADDFEIELDVLVQPLVALLASYFIWLDDEAAKATMYYNLYDDMKNQILSSAGRPVAARFVGGVAWRD